MFWRFSRTEILVLNIFPVIGFQLWSELYCPETILIRLQWLHHDYRTSLLLCMRYRAESWSLRLLQINFKNCIIICISTAGFAAIPIWRVHITARSSVLSFARCAHNSSVTLDWTGFERIVNTSRRFYPRVRMTAESGKHHIPETRVAPNDEQQRAINRFLYRKSVRILFDFIVDWC